MLIIGNIYIYGIPGQIKATSLRTEGGKTGSVLQREMSKTFDDNVVWFCNMHLIVAVILVDDS